MGFVVNKERQFAGENMKTVLVKETNEVLAFPNDMSDAEVEHAIKIDRQGEITEYRPTLYDNVVRPALRALNFDIKSPRVMAKAFSENFKESVSAGIYHIPEEERTKLQKYAPGSSVAGQFAGFGVFAIPVLNGLGAASKSPTIAKTLGMFGQKIAGIAARNPNLAPAIAAAQRFLTAGAQAGAVAGIHTEISGIANQIRDPNQPELDFGKIGVDALKSAGMWTVAGGFSGIIAKPILGMKAPQVVAQISKEAAVSAGTMYSVARLGGEDHKDALLQAGMAATFHVFSVAGHTYAARKHTVEQMQKLMADYVKASNTVIDPSLARQTGREYIASVAEEVVRESKIVDAADPIETVSRHQELTQKLIERVAENVSGIEKSNVPRETLSETNKELQNKTITAEEIEASPAPDPIKKALKDANAGRELTPEEVAAQKFILHENEQARTAYIVRSIQEFKADNVVSSDVGKFAVPGMKSTLSAAYHEAGSALAKAREAELLAMPETKDLPVGFSAGGSGAGKSFALRGVGYDLQNGFALIHDTNLNNIKSAITKIERAVASGRKVEIMYVYRDPLTAYAEGVIPRVRTQDRIVPIKDHIETHMGVRPTLEKIEKAYPSSKVEIRSILNTGKKGELRNVNSLAEVPKIKYTKTELRNKLYEVLKDAHATGKITAEEFKIALTGSPELQARAAKENALGADGSGRAKESAKLRSKQLSESKRDLSITPTDSRPITSPQDFVKRIEQLNKFASSRAILRKGSKMKNAAGEFVGIPKEGEVKLSQKTLFNNKDYMTTLSHELGHALEYNVTGKTNNAGWKFFGEKLDAKTRAAITKELRDITHELVGADVASAKSEYYYKPSELLARFFEKMFVSPGNLSEIAPTAMKMLEMQAIKHPIIQEFLEAAKGNIDKGAPAFVFLRDMRQTYQKYLGKRAGDMAYDEMIAYRAMKERAKIVLEKFIADKFKGIKDSPESLFMSAESIKVTRGGVPEFGTRDFITAKNPAEEAKFIELGYERVEMPQVEGREAVPVYAKPRYTAEQGKKIFDALSDAGKKLITDFTAQRSEAKDYFNREIIKDVNKVNGNIEGWVHHFFEDSGGTLMGGDKLKNKKAGTRQQRTGSEGYVKDFQKAMTKALVDLEGEKVYNDFVKRFFARVTEPIAEGTQPKTGWVEVAGNLRTGVGLTHEKRMTVIDKETGKTVPVSQQRYQMPEPIYEQFKLWRGATEEASMAVRLVNDLNRYWRINILTHPGTVGTNHISGAVAYSSKILTDFYTEILTGNLKMNQTKSNISAMIKVLMPKGWAEAPDWVYGSDLSNFYGQFMKQKSPVSQAIDTYGNNALKLFGTVERYWKKVILTSENVKDIRSLEKMDKEGLRLPTAEERAMIAELNKAVDLYAYDYDNVPTWIEAHQRSAVGQAVKPFMKYPYKYAKMILDMVGSAFDQTQPWQERVAKILTLSTIVGVYSKFSDDRKKLQETPIAEASLEIPARLQTRGRIFVGKDDQGNEMFMRVGKYPFLGLTEAGKNFINGKNEAAVDAVSDMIGSIGPMAKLGLLLGFNYRNKYEQYDDVPVIIGRTLATYTPAYRILNDVSRMLDPFQRKQETFSQTFTALIPTTDEDLQDKLHGKIRTERIPVENNITGNVRGRTTVEMPLPNYRDDILVGLLFGIYLTRIDPDKAKAYITRAEKNKIKQDAKEAKEKSK